MTRWRAWALGLCLVQLGCRIPNEDHCGRRDNDATCRGIDPARPYCSICEAENDGCVASLAEIPAECRQDDAAELGGESETTSTDTGSGESETGPAPDCGNGIKEAGEQCDGLDFGDATCDDPYQLPEGMLVCVPGECVIDTSQCCLPDGHVCEQGECCNANCNPITNKCGL